MTDVLSDRSAPFNAAHQALAELCSSGVHVWTVNFDAFIERSAPTPLRLTCWPDTPQRAGAAELLKPHGTLGGRLAVTPEEVLKPIDPAWLQRFRADIDASTTVVLLGYSGREYDFHSEWDKAISGQNVVWFDFPDRGDGDRNRMRRPFVGADEAGRLSFPPPTALPKSSGEPGFNPCWDFVTWCRHRGLVTTARRFADPAYRQQFVTVTYWPYLGRTRNFPGSVCGRAHSRRPERNPHGTSNSQAFATDAGVVSRTPAANRPSRQCRP